jgi:hypothetical protein
MMRDEIGTVWFQTRSPRDGDLGAVEPGHYYVADGVLFLCDERGKSNSEGYALGPDDVAHQVAGRLAKSAWRERSGTSDFNRPLHYLKMVF